MRLQMSNVPVPQPLYPTLGSLQEVIDMANSKIPIIHWNEVHSILMSYHNTLLKVIGESNAG